MSENKNEKWLPLQKKIHEFQARIDEEIDTTLISINSAQIYRTTYIPNLKTALKGDADFRNEGLEETLDRPCHIGFSDGSHILHHQSTYRRIITIAENPGKIENRLAGNLIVTIYHLWENKYRAEIAKLLSIPKADLKADIWGYLALIRVSILKKDYKAVRQLNRYTTIKLFNHDEAIILDTATLETIKDTIHQWCDDCLTQKLLEKAQQQLPITLSLKLCD